MVFLFNSTGAIVSFTPEKVYQGSNKATVIYFLSPFPLRNDVYVAFKLPNGSVKPKTLMSRAVDFDWNIDTMGMEVNAWSYEVLSEITELSGVVTVQFFINESTGKIIATESAQFNVEVGVKVAREET